jgi:hypothetical protein
VKAPNLSAIVTRAAATESRAYDRLECKRILTLRKGKRFAERRG